MCACMSVFVCMCAHGCSCYELITFLCSSTGQTEDGNNMYGNFNVRATPNHRDLCEELTMGHF